MHTRILIKRWQRDRRRALQHFGVVFATSALLFAALMLLQAIELSSAAWQGRFASLLMVVPRQAEARVEDLLLTGTAAHGLYLDRSVIETVRALPGVEAVTPQVYATTLRSPCCNVADTALVGYDPATDFVVQPWIERRNPDVPAGSSVVVGFYFWRSGRPEVVRLYGRDFEPEGALGCSGYGLDRTIFVPFDLLKQLARGSAKTAEAPLQLPEAKISALYVKPRDPGAQESLRTAIRDRIPDAAVLMPSRIFRQTGQSLGTLKWASIVAMALLWVIMAVVLAAVNGAAARERRREVGLYSALGASRRWIARLVVGESLLLSVAGAVAGMAVALFAVAALGDLVTTRGHIPLALPDARTGVPYAAGLLGLVGATTFVASYRAFSRVLRADAYESMREGLSDE